MAQFNDVMKFDDYHFLVIGSKSNQIYEENNSYYFIFI